MSPKAAAAEAAAAADAGPELLVTTTKTKDFLGRSLTNPTPGTSQATDYLGRSVAPTDRDFLARLLI